MLFRYRILLRIRIHLKIHVTILTKRFNFPLKGVDYFVPPNRLHFSSSSINKYTFINTCYYTHVGIILLLNDLPNNLTNQSRLKRIDLYPQRNLVH